MLTLDLNRLLDMCVRDRFVGMNVNGIKHSKIF
jgi:hypothetical protein